MKKATLTEDKAEQTSTGGVLVGKREGQTIIHNKGTLSGYLVGKTHAEGGIKAVNKSTGQPLEMQGGEVVITAPAVSDNTKREFEGKMMTNREILSTINEKGGGVAFASGGDVPKSIKHTGASYKYGGKTMTDHEIMMKINGGHLAEGYSLREIASIHQVPLSELKKQVRLGMKAESEHTPSKREQMKIVKDHLFENPKYYTLLKKAGLKDGGEIESLYKDENDYVKYLVERNLTDGVEEYKLQEYLKSKGLSSVGLLPDNIKKDPEYIKIKKDYDLAFKKLQNLPIYKYPKNRDRVQDQKDLRKAREISEKIIQIKLKKESFANGGQTESLVRDAKSGNTPARDLNNYNDVLDLDADGMVGAETSLYAIGGLIAPNGHKTNLTPEQYKLVRTPEFKAWFGDWENDPENASKVVDENGEPLVVYHGTNSEFNVFDNSKINASGEQVFKFTTNYDMANAYGEKVFSVFLSIKNNNIGSKFYPKMGLSKFYANTTFTNARLDLIYESVKAEESQGGVIYGLTSNDFKYKGDVYFVHFSNQIKLADGTNTKFDNMNPDIRYADGGMFNTEPFLNYYFDEIAEFLKYQNNITLNKDFTFKYKGELFRVEPIVLSEKNIKEAYFSIIDSDNEEVGDIVFNPNNNKKFEANSDFFDWNNIKFYDGGNVKPYDANMEGDSADMIFAEGGAVSSVVNNWDEVPSIWKNTSKVKKVAWTNSPYDKGLYSIVAPFLGKDELRPYFGGINFDENGITVTDAHKLISLPYPNKKFEGIYEADLSKRVDSEQITIDGKYPDYPAVIPSYENTTHYLVDVYKLLQYSKVSEKYSNNYTHLVSFKIADTEYGFNANYLIVILTTMLKLGHEKIYAHYSSSNRPMVFTPSKNYELGNDEILLLMPTMIKDSFLGARDLDYNRELSVYYDFNDNEIHNADGSIADFKMNYENNSVISKEDVTLLEKLANGKNRLSILNYVLVKNGVAKATDLETQYELNGIDLPNGIYKSNKGALEITMEAMEDFPSNWKFQDDNDTLQFVISSDIFEYYIDKMQYIVGKDDLRPIMQGVCLHHTSDNKLFLASTDAHLLLKINITEYVDMPVYNREIKSVLQPINLYNFLNSTENTALQIKSNKSNTIISNGDRTFYCRNLDGNFPNYDAVIPTLSSKLAIFGLEQIRKAMNGEKVKSYLKESEGAFILNKENEIFVAINENRSNYNEQTQIKKIEKICDTSFDFRFEEFYKDDKSILLIMPVMCNQQTNFAFGTKILQRALKVINDNKLELHYNELNSAYLVPIHSLDYKTTTKEHKVREQKPSVAEIKLVSSINEVNEIKEAIETLEMLSETATRKDKKEIKEAVEVLQMLLDTYEY